MAGETIAESNSRSAVAGTRPRSADRAEDDRLRRELLESEKDRREHAFVLDQIRETFGEIGLHVRVDTSPGELRLARSRHLYGDAADIYVDDDGDGQMDDLNEDGAVDVQDARLLAEIVEAQRDEPWYAPFVGGLGVYGPAPHRGPFIHVDTRGEPVRW